jgi:hypothetical protein
VQITSGTCAGFTVPARQVFYKATRLPSPGGSETDGFSVFWTTPDYRKGACPTCAIGQTTVVKISVRCPPVAPASISHCIAG